MGDVMSTFGELPDDTKAELFGQLADQVSKAHEHSMVDGEVRRKISAIVSEEVALTQAGMNNESTIVQRVAHELSPVEMEGIIADWMRAQIAL
jgi:hypothetical protein